MILSRGLGRVGLKGLAVRLRMARPIQSQLLESGSLQLFPTPRPGGRPRCIAAKQEQHTRPLSKRSSRVHCNASCSASMRIVPRDTGRPVTAAALRPRHCSGHAEDRRQAASSQVMEPHWLQTCRKVAVRPHFKLAGRTVVFASSRPSQDM